MEERENKPTAKVRMRAFAAFAWKSLIRKVNGYNNHNKYNEPIRQANKYSDLYSAGMVLTNQLFDTEIKKALFEDRASFKRKTHDFILLKTKNNSLRFFSGIF